ncbi:CYTH domain-containing protein [Bacillus sp. 165]|uniref:CYTH domain-containing protein n=1 Tax=Bacillus sp. 165 TaxID=1529117 RepID=UPI001ADC309A|nr:CYTH domain-containing protein [Bacillus sp. 165]MBO9128638.1 CYTH domain-containing protein [Bacillus sp. 165]
MKQEIEIELKNIVTKQEFETLVNAFNIHSFSTQVNHYFETPSFSLKDKGAALRIRFKNDAYTLTLKQPAKVGLLETHQSLTKEDATRMIQTGKIVPGGILNLLHSLSVLPDELQYLGELTTNRAEIIYKGGILMFDHSFYFDTDDYELEYEVKDEQEGRKQFLELLQSHHIPVRHTENKIKRFFLEKQKRSK